VALLGKAAFLAACHVGFTLAPADELATSVKSATTKRVTRWNFIKCSTISIRR
jgi:hypothetical protein